MLQIEPAEIFPIIRIISNHLDTNTYYVRAVIKDAVNDTVLATVDLADKGNRYFRTNWKVIWDNALSRGRYISITTSIYTDSDYTTKSPDYGDDIQTYLVQDRWDPYKQGGGSDISIDFGEFRKIIKEEIKNIEIPETEEIKFPEIKEYNSNFEDISKQIKEVDKKLNNVPEEIDLKPILKKLDSLQYELDVKPVTPKTDLEPLKKMIKQYDEKHQSFKEEIMSNINKIENKLLNNIIDSISETLKVIIPAELKEAIKKANFSIPFPMFSQQDNENKKEQSNINKLKAKFNL